MALRLTTNSLAGADTAPSATTLELGNESVGLLAARAERLLTSGDAGAFAELFAAAIAIEHEIPRYRATKLLIEQGLRHASATEKQIAVAIMLATAGGAVEALEADPAQPRLLNYAGVLLYELWALEAARALFEAARRLDPEVPHLERNLNSTRERMLERKRVGHRRPAAVHPSVRELSLRAKRVALSAKPADGRRISLCMIVRDEEDMLERTLAAVAPAVDEMIIVDTGSQDRTIEIARSFDATVIEHDWTGDFGAARNISLDAATGDWILYLDADEVLVADDAERLREHAGHTWHEAIFFDEINFTGNDETGVTVVHAALRMIRNRPEYRFAGRLHEQIAHTLPADLPECIAQTSIRINHYGYLGVVRDSKEKSRRNLELLQKQVEDGADNAFLHYNLGSEHFALGEVDVALREFERAWDLLAQEAGTTHHEFVPSLMARFVKALRAAGRHEDAIAKAELGLDRFPGFTDLVYEQGLASLQLDREDDAVTYFEQAIEMGDAPSRYTAIVGAGTFMPRIILAVRHLGRGEVDRAVALMQWCIENHPDFYGVLHPYATALLKAGREPEEIVAEVERHAGRVTGTMRFMLGTALFEQGAAPAAEMQFRLVLEAQPHSGPARAALVETLLYQRRYADAAGEAAALDADSGLAPSVLRSELFARLLAGDLDGTRAGLDRCGDARLPIAERALFESWLQLASGQESAPLPVATVPLLEVMLEALLRVQDFDGFEAVHRVLAVTELPERERRERLAHIYMRRGFVKSAAREWIAVCESTPDARALVGLAQVAVANGQAEAAATFAREALSLEPGNPVALAVLDAEQPLAA